MLRKQYKNQSCCLLFHKSQYKTNHEINLSVRILAAGITKSVSLSTLAHSVPPSVGRASGLQHKHDLQAYGNKVLKIFCSFEPNSIDSATDRTPCAGKFRLTLNCWPYDRTSLTRLALRC